MKLKKLLLLAVLTLGLASCSNDNEGDNSSEIEYSDVKPTQSKYKAYYGQVLVKTTSTTSRAPVTTGTSQNGATAKPVSVIFYPRTQTISFSNIFDNKTVEYKVTGITNNPGVSVVYSFKINDSTFICTISEKAGAVPANVVVTFAGGFYNFDITDSAKMKISQLVSLSKTTFAPNDAVYNNTIRYIYADTLLIQSVKNYFDEKTSEPLVSTEDYSYEGGKLISKTTKKSDGTVVKKIEYKYENGLITKSKESSPEKETGTSTYEYDKQGRIVTSSYKNSTTGADNIMYFSYEKNKLTIIYTNSKKTYIDTDVVTYNSDSKIHLISQDGVLYPLLFLNYTSIVTTDDSGNAYSSEYSYEFSPEGLMVKMKQINSTNPTLTVREYVEE